MNNKLNHIAIILDGNGRWAKKRGLLRSYGHYKGMLNLIDIASIANEAGVKMLTVFGFSTENWQRPKDEVDFLMQKPIEILSDKFNAIQNSSIKIQFIGIRSNLNKDLVESIVKVEEATKAHTGMLLNIAFNYGSQDELIEVIKKIENPKEITKEELENLLYIKEPVDFLIRTSGEMRISNFLLWQIAYAELYFPKTTWPDFGKKAFYKALKEYNKRKRRFGRIDESRS